MFVTSSVPGKGDYSWRSWAEDSTGQASGYSDYTAGSGPAFSVDPSAPIRPQQYRMDGRTILWVGAQSPEVGVVLQAVVQSPQGNMARAQFEVKPVNAPFDGTSLVLGSCVQAGCFSQATALLPAGDYQWRVRTEDAGGGTSLWVGFGGNDDVVPPPADFELTGAAGGIMAYGPSNLGQWHTDGVTPIPLGGTTSEDKILLTGPASNPAGLPSALEVEVKAWAAAFDGTSTVTGAYASDGTTLQVVISPGAGSFHWRARTTDSQAAVSVWVDFSTNATSADFILSPVADSPPDVPQNLQEYQYDGVTGMAPSDPLTGPGVNLKATVSDPDPGNGLVLEVEIRLWGIPFSNVPTAASGVVQSGQTARLTPVILTRGQSYHWQARTIDSDGAASPWIEYTGVTPSIVTAPPSSGGGGTGGGQNCSASVSASSGSPWVFGVLLGALLTLGIRRRSGTLAKGATPR
jgi:MYXO-CTERM domain-containing protein